VSRPSRPALLRGRGEVRLGEADEEIQRPPRRIRDGVETDPCERGGNRLFRLGKRQEEPVCDRLVGETLGDEREHLALERRKRLERSHSRRRKRSATTAASSAASPRATRRAVSANSSASATRSFSR
jgi:hypothetical protein